MEKKKSENKRRDEGWKSSLLTIHFGNRFGESLRACDEGFETLGKKFSFGVETIPP